MGTKIEILPPLKELSNKYEMMTNHVTLLFIIFHKTGSPKREDGGLFAFAG